MDVSAFFFFVALFSCSLDDVSNDNLNSSARQRKGDIGLMLGDATGNALGDNDHHIHVGQKACHRLISHYGPHLLHHPLHQGLLVTVKSDQDRENRINDNKKSKVNEMVEDTYSSSSSLSLRIERSYMPSGPVPEAGGRVGVLARLVAAVTTS
jgi:hypothetical protein